MTTLSNHPAPRKTIGISLKETELERIRSGFENSTQGSLSGFCRSVLLGRPITIYTRSKSLDNFIDEMIVLRNELNEIRNCLRLSVTKLLEMKEIPEIHAWAVLNEKSKEMLFKKTDEIKEKIYQISDKWLQK